MILFADDTNLFLSGPNLDDICIQLNIQLKKSRRFKLYKLSLHKERQISLYTVSGKKVPPYFCL